MSDLAVLQPLIQHVNSITRDKVFEAESLMKQLPQLELQVRHYFSLGVYARELYIPRDTILVGKLHKFPNLNILTQGELSVLIDDQIQRIKAPYVVASPAGIKRIAYAHENTIWITVHATEETNVNAIEEHFIAKSEQEYIDFCNGQERLRLFA